MEQQDLVRELMKISQVLDRVTEYLENQSQGNAFLHMSDKVMYPPLTSAAILANKELSQLIVRLNDNG